MVAYAEGKSSAPIMNLKVRFTGDTVKQQRFGGGFAGLYVSALNLNCSFFFSE